MSLALADDKSILVQIMAWCRQATNHYLSQFWPRSIPSYCVTRPQWVDISGGEEIRVTCFEFYSYFTKNNAIFWLCNPYTELDWISSQAVLADVIVWRRFPHSSQERARYPPNILCCGKSEQLLNKQSRCQLLETSINRSWENGIFSLPRALTHWGLVTSFGDIDQSQHWFR